MESCPNPHERSQRVTQRGDESVSNAREHFLQQVRQAVAQGNRAGHAPALPSREGAGDQGAGLDPASRFAQEFTAAGGHFHRAADQSSAVALVLDVVRRCGARSVLLGGGGFIDSLGLGEALRAAGLAVAGADREEVFAADVGITGVDFLVAETGSLVLASRPNQPRAFSLLPPVHIALAEPTQIMADLFDLFEPGCLGEQGLPSALSLVTGPSKTGDIELRLVTGVHGPGEVHLVLVAAPPR
jgi:L-lactate dehydrogenase complex protein LldG